MHLDIRQPAKRSTCRSVAQTESVASAIQNSVGLRRCCTPRAFVARDFVQERTNFVQERNFGCLSVTWHTCTASVVALRSTPVRTSRQTTWETRNDLEDSEGCRSVGGHGNQHVRLRSAQVEHQGDRPGSGSKSAVSSRAGVGFLDATVLLNLADLFRNCFEEILVGAAVCNDPKSRHAMSFSGSPRLGAAMARALSPECARFLPVSVAAASGRSMSQV